ncbi:MAG: pyridoxine 5'-phosphate synthase [Spirochaetes bacterium]|nr:pyridoxine 5'-phosphate synthase [Spirochaetota bacterium]
MNTREFIRLGVNVDHIATVRNARGENDPSLVELALVAQHSGADLITIHLREDRRHIRDADVFDLKRHLKIPLNFEMALSEEILAVALKAAPATACIVPERREEVTTEGGLDAARHLGAIKRFTQTLQDAQTDVYLFVEPDLKTVEYAAQAGVKGVEFHTGAYARAFTVPERRKAELVRLETACKAAAALGLKVHAGHGLNYFNVSAVCAIAELHEFNIGHAIIARSLAVGLEQAVFDMKALLTR